MEDKSQVVIDFIKSQRESVLSVVLDQNQPHAATMLYSYSLNNFGENTSESLDKLVFYFMTQGESQKTQALAETGSCSAALVIGMKEGPNPSLQLHGELREVTDQMLRDKIKEHHFLSYPKSRDFEKPTSMFLTFKPSWWRFTDYRQKPPVITLSTD